MEKDLKWFVIRTPLGQEQKGMNYLSGKGIKTFTPTVTQIKEIDGVPTPVTVYSLPLLFFAQGTEQTMKTLVERNPEADYLRFYYRYYNEGGKRRRQIITIPQTQMNSFLKICEAKDLDMRIYNEVIHKFDKGKRVRVIEGPYQGVEGRAIRIFGQQRVGVIIDDILTAVTSYVPSAYLEKVEEE